MGEKNMEPIRGFRDLRVYNLAYETALQVHREIAPFLPQEERFDLIDQIKRSSKAVPRLIAEGYAKRHQQRGFQKYLSDAMGESNEMVVSISQARDIYPHCVKASTCDELIRAYDIVGRQLYKLMTNWTNSKNPFSKLHPPKQASGSKLPIPVLILIAFLMSACAKSGTSTSQLHSFKPASSSQLLTPVPEGRIYFPFGSDYILPESSSEIDRNIKWLEENDSIYIILEGHCDEVGPSEYNMELGDRRARRVKAYMIERGVSPERIIMVVSYGSTRPLNPGHTIADLRENRRVEFVVR